MVQFPRYRFCPLCIHEQMNAIQDVRVTPFGHPRIQGCLLLPVAFRSLPRPSSPDSSKASPANSSSLDHITPTSSVRRSIKQLGISTSRKTRAKRASQDVFNLLCSLLCRTRDASHKYEAVKDPPPAQGRANGAADKGLCRSTRRQAAAAAILCPGGMGIRTPDLWLAKPSL